MICYATNKFRLMNKMAPTGQTGCYNRSDRSLLGLWPWLAARRAAHAGGDAGRRCSEAVRRPAFLGEAGACGGATQGRRCDAGAAHM